jgi:hypothetical protein
LKNKKLGRKEKVPIVEPKGATNDDEDAWSTFGNLPTYSNDSRRSRLLKEKEEQRKNNSIDMVFINK